MNKKLLLISGFFFLIEFSFAQELYMPRNIQNAIENGTRTITGEPGLKYWQNKGVYDIRFQLTPPTRIISGSESIVYSNKSPDTLKVLTIRFIPNIHKPNSPRGYYAGNDFLDSGMTITTLSVNGTGYNENAANWGTVGIVKLKDPILPRSKATVKIDWHYPLSKQDGREGQIDSTTFFAAYAYPRISVYDDYNGWDLLDHTGRQEFYNDFNDYTYSVTVPKDYIVYGTGDFLNPDEVLQTKFAQRLKSSYQSDEIINISNFDEVTKGEVTAQKDLNTWKFSARHITDIVFAASKNYVWDASSVVVDRQSGRRVSVQAAYNDTAQDFKHYVEWARASLDFFSNNWPGVPYPFSKMTSVQGHADMEYPMMVNDATTPDFRFSRLVQDHEIAHTYFPFYMGTNETRYAFMDEGWATMFEYLAGIKEFGRESADEFFKAFRSRRYISNPATESDMPIITLSSQENGIAYSANSYPKAAMSYLALKDMLGDSTFKAALHHYMDLWNGKHPIPWDYFNAMNAGSGQNLNWFFENWFFTNNYIDLKIADVTKLPDGYNVKVGNIGGFAIPFDLVVEYADGQKETMHQTPKVWQRNPKSLNFKLSSSKEIKSITIDNGIYIDATSEDNVFKF